MGAGLDDLCRSLPTRTNLSHHTRAGTSTALPHHTARSAVNPIQYELPVLDSLPVLLLLDELSPLVRTVIPPKLAVFVMAGFRFRLELSESVLLHGLWWSVHFNSFSVLLCRLPDAFPTLSLLPLRTSGDKGVYTDKTTSGQSLSLGTLQGA